MGKYIISDDEILNIFVQGFTAGAWNSNSEPDHNLKELVNCGLCRHYSNVIGKCCFDMYNMFDMEKDCFCSRGERCD